MNQEKEGRGANTWTEDLYAAILSLCTPEEVAALLADLCTTAEVQEMSRRFAAARMLARGDSYLEVAENTGLSTATISRVSRCLKGDGGGYHCVLGRLSDGGNA